MSFASESEAVGVLQNSFKPPRLCENKTITVREFSIGFGIADLVFFELSRNPAPAITEPIESESTLSVLELFHHRDMLTFDQISSLAHVSVGTVRRKAKKLVDLGYLEITQKGYRRKIKYKPIVRKVIAVEVKLANWRRALIQAFKYTVFANQSYVAIDASYAHRATANIEQFHRSNVGLLSISDDGHISYHYEPKWDKPSTTYTVAKLNERVKAFM